MKHTKPVLALALLLLGYGVLVTILRDGATIKAQFVAK
jgi:hypothetical protein